MVTIRRGDDRGHTTYGGWLDSRHAFSFGDYFDPAAMGFRSLRVLNDDRVAGGGGFPTHGHRDMEILSYVIEGALEHQDSAGGGGVIRPGEIQFMRAGSGVRHSEFNHSPDEPVHFLQIWIVPERQGLAPAYRQQAFDRARAAAAPLLLASRDGRDGSIALAQDADVYTSRAPEATTHRLPLAPGRQAWLQVASGAITLGGERLVAGDAAMVTDEPHLEWTGAAPDTDVLVFDLA
ncbi:MAG: pirin family protein [Vicinamibacterales bacterium]